MARTLETTTRQTLGLIEGDASWTGDDLTPKRWVEFLKRASLNRVLLMTAGTLQKHAQNAVHLADLERVLAVGGEFLRKQRDTQNAIAAAMASAGIPYLIIKSYSEVLHATWDVDMLVPVGSLEAAGEALRKQIGEAKLTPGHGQVNVDSKDLLTIDTHQGPLWIGDEYCDNSLLWHEPRTVTFNGDSFPAPSATAEFTVMIAHLIHERLHITLMDFLALEQLIPSVDWDIVFHQAKAHGWRRSLRRILAIHDHLAFAIRGERQIAPRLGGSADAHGEKLPPTYVGGKLMMPYVYPIPYAAEIFLERTLNGHLARVLEIGPYYGYALIRYNVTRKIRVPIFDHWFPFDTLPSVAGR